MQKEKLGQIYLRLKKSRIFLTYTHRPIIGMSLKKRKNLANSITFTNHNPITIGILPVISKTYERLLYDQMYQYFDQIFSKFQCGFPKAFATQNYLLYMIWKTGRSF